MTAGTMRPTAARGNSRYQEIQAHVKSIREVNKGNPQTGASGAARSSTNRRGFALAAMPPSAGGRRPGVRI